VITWDGRDDRFQPSAGGFVTAAYVYYPAGAVSGAGAFGKADLDVRWFFAPRPRHALGFQVKLEGAHGETPVTILPNIGGNDTFRGYVDGRYRDRLGYSGQLEWRFPIAGRFRGTAFVGAGGVAHDLPDLGARAPRLAGGAGLRFRLTSTGAYLRVDAAYGEDGLQIYFLTMEAF
jgi:outer membrane protein assembly factor BamA